MEGGSHWKAARTVRSLRGWVGRKLSPNIPSFPSNSSAPLMWERSLRNSSICMETRREVSLIIIFSSINILIVHPMLCHQGWNWYPVTLTWLLQEHYSSFSLVLVKFVVLVWKGRNRQRIANKPPLKHCNTDSSGCNKIGTVRCLTDRSMVLSTRHVRCNNTGLEKDGWVER